MEQSTLVSGLLISLTDKVNSHCPLQTIMKAAGFIPNPRARANLSRKMKISTKAVG